jgi:hypothetical protein
MSTAGVRRGAAALAGALGCALGCAAPSPLPPEEPALVALEVLRGFDAAPGPHGEPRVVALLDATRAMSGRGAEGIAHFAAARAAAARWLRELPPDTGVELRVQAGEPSAACASPARRLAGPEPAANASLAAALENLAPAGEGSVAEGLFELAAELDAAPTPLRVVVWSALRDRCDASLCAAAQALARRGARLDLIVLGDGAAPDCLAELTLPGDAVPPETPATPIGFRVERLAPVPAVVGCSEAGGLPVAVPSGPSRLVVALDPPLILERSFPPGTHWTLEVLDFPTLGRDTREWHWRPFAGAPPREEGAE